MSNNNNMKIKNIMSKIITCDYKQPLNEICTVMKINNIGFLPITKNNKVIGVITDRDIVVKICSNKDDKIEGYLSKNIVSVDINDDINKLIELFKRYKIKRILVKENNNYIGVISLSDLINKIDIYNTIKTVFSLNNNKNESNCSINDFEL